MPDVVAADGVTVPVGEERDVAEIEDLRPGDVRPRAVPRDTEDLDAGRVELLSPVTQERQLVRSGARPVEEVEEEDVGVALGHLRQLDLVAGRQPYRGLKRRLFLTCELRLMGRLLATNLGDRAS